MLFFTCPVTFQPRLSSADQRGQEAMAGIITSQNTRRPLSSVTATQHFHNALYKQVDRSCAPHCRHRQRERTREGEVEVSRREEGMRNRRRKRRNGKTESKLKEKTNGWAVFAPRVQITTILMRKYLTFVFL